MDVMYYAGYMGWSIYGALSVFNTVYYMDIYKRNYMDTVYDNWDKMSFWSIWGASSFLRVHCNIIAWFIMSFFWMISIFGWSHPALHIFFHGVTEIMMVVWMTRIFAVIVMQLFALVIDSHEDDFRKFDYFKVQAWGAELGVDELYDAVDIELEAFNILAQGVAYGLYTLGQPLFISQLDKETVIERDGATCQLCFKKRYHDHDEAPAAEEKEPEVDEFTRNCERIRNQCELEARRESAKMANRTA